MMKSKILNSIWNRSRSGFEKRVYAAANCLFVLLLSANMTFAQTATTAESSSATGLNGTEIVLLVAFGLLLLLVLLVLIVALHVLSFLKLVATEERPKAAAIVGEKKKKESLWTKLNRRFVSGELVPVSQEKEIMLDHSYDGISELNNHMPPWLKYLFYGTVAAAFVYVLHYMVLDTGKLQLEEYQEELAEAEKLGEERKLLAKSSIDENTAALVSDEAELEKAAMIYLQNCAPCHAKDGGGTVGPNLTDEYWLHGGSVKDIFTVIKYGVQEKGMIPWEDKLKPEEIQSVASYILSLQGSTPASPKEPQGEKYENEAPEQALISSLQ